MYLKALYIFEHNMSGVQIDDIWNKLKNSEFKVDSNGQLLYRTSSGITTFAKYDTNGEPLKDSNGKIIYYDKNNNRYNENNRGSKIKRNGHQLDRLIESLSLDSGLLLESRMLSIPMNSTEQNKDVSILDFLQNKGIIVPDQFITQDQYISWIEQHKKTFEESRYSGQKHYDINIAFLYHLTTQIKAVAQYKIEPKNIQKFTITDEEISNLPNEIQQLTSFHSHLLSEDLLKLISNNNEVKDKIIAIFSKKYILPNSITPQNFLNMVKEMSPKEIETLSILCYAIENHSQSNDKINDNKYMNLFTALKLSPNTIITFVNELKSKYGESFTIDKNSLELIFKVLEERMILCKYGKLSKISIENKIEDKKGYKESLFSQDYKEISEIKLQSYRAKLKSLLQRKDEEFSLLQDEEKKIISEEEMLKQLLKNSKNIGE